MYASIAIIYHPKLNASLGPSICVANGRKMRSIFYMHWYATYWNSLTLSFSHLFSSDFSCCSCNDFLSFILIAHVAFVASTPWKRPFKFCQNINIWNYQSIVRAVGTMATRRFSIDHMPRAQCAGIHLFSNWSQRRATKVTRVCFIVSTQCVGSK